MLVLNNIILINLICLEVHCKRFSNIPHLDLSSANKQKKRKCSIIVFSSLNQNLTVNKGTIFSESSLASLTQTTSI